VQLFRVYHFIRSYEVVLFVSFMTLGTVYYDTDILLAGVFFICSIVYSVMAVIAACRRFTDRFN